MNRPRNASEKAPRRAHSHQQRAAQAPSPSAAAESRGQSRGGDAPGHAWLRVHGPTWQTSFYPLPANAMELADNGLGGCQNPTCGLQMSLGPANPAGRSVRYERLPSICFRCCSRRSTAIVGGGGSFREQSINPALHPDCYYLLWFKLSDWGHFLYVAIRLLPEGIVERKEKKVNLARKQGRSRVFSRQLAELTSGSP